LVVARTLQSVARLFYDVLPLVSRDTSIQTVFTVDRGSQFSDGVPQFLSEHGAKVVPWERVVSGDFVCDVAVSASANGELHLLPGKLLLMSHGAGHHKFRAADTGVGSSVSGLDEAQLTVDGVVVPSVIALGGPEQLDRLRTSCPAAVDHALVTGDVCLERLQAGLPHRRRYRHHLGLTGEQKLILVSSTWGGGSLLGQYPKLVDRLTAQLPADEYRVAVALHPNSWDRHGRPQVFGWLAAARRAGLIVIPPHEGWRAAVVASDCVIGDHGSVGFYSAALDRPLLIACFDQAEVPVDSPASQLREVAPKLVHTVPLRQQIEDAMSGHVSGRYTALTSRSIDPCMTPGNELRHVIYRLLDLEPPGDNYVAAPPPAPTADAKPITSHYVFPVEATDGDPAVIAVERFPVATADTGDDCQRGRDRVLVVDAAEPDQRLWLAASVMTWTESELAVPQAQEWVKDMTDTVSGLSTAVALTAEGLWWLWSRRRGEFLVGGDDAGLASAAAVLHLLGRTADLPARLTVRLGRQALPLWIDPLT
jgi:hypothetical protein